MEGLSSSLRFLFKEGSEPALAALIILIIFREENKHSMPFVGHGSTPSQ